MKRYNPTPDQERAIKRMLSEPTRAALNVSDLGSGKTLQAVELALRMGAKIVLVIAPIGTHKGWKSTFERQGWALPIRNIDPKHPENHAALVQGEKGLYLVGREFFYLSANPSKPGKNGERKRKARWLWTKANADLVILDESHSAKQRYGLMFKTLKTLPKNSYRLAMSATPQGSHFDGIWAPTRWLWPEYPGPVDRSKQRWIAQWCETEKVWIGNGEYATKVVGEKEPGAFLRSLPCVVGVKVDKKPYKLFDVKVTLSPEHKAVWDEMATTSIAWMNDNPTVAKLPMEKRLRLRQMALAMPDINEEGEVSFVQDAESPKLRAALKIQDRHPGEPILYVTDSAKFARIAALRLGAKLLVGGMKKADRDWLIDNLGTEYSYLVATYGAVAEGCFLPETEIMTDRGFVALSELSGGEKVLCQRQDETPQFRGFRKVEIPFEGDLPTLRLQQITLPVTGNHNFDFWNYKAGTHSVEPVDYIRGKEGSIPSNLIVPESAEELSPREKLFVATQADGSLMYDNYFTAGFNKERKIVRFREILDKSQVDWKVISPGKTVWRVRYRLPEVSCKEDLFSVFPVEKLTPGKCQALLNEMVQWDGYLGSDGNIVYRSKNPRACDFYELVATLAGRSFSRSVVKPKKDNWSDMHTLIIFRSGRNYAQYSNKKTPSPIDYRGTLHCVNVGGRKCVFRYKNKVFVARNSDGLQARCSIEVLFNPPDSAVMAEQFSGRLNRIGQKADYITRYRLIAKDTLDDEHYVTSVFNQKLRRAEIDLGGW